MLGRRQARRMSRRFATVGVGIPPARLREMAAGAPAADDELTDVNFAFVATEIERAQRHAKFVHCQRCAVWLLVVTGTVLLMLTVLICMAYGMISLAEHTSPY